jgi:hypothetical protein
MESYETMFDKKDLKTAEDCLAAVKRIASPFVPEVLRNVSAKLRTAELCLTAITIPNSVTTIRGGAFMKCTSLASVTIINGATLIDDGVFSDCDSLDHIIIGNEKIDASIYKNI